MTNRTCSCGALAEGKFCPNCGKPTQDSEPDLIGQVASKLRRVGQLSWRYCLTCGYVFRRPLVPLDRNLHPKALGPGESAFATFLLLYTIGIALYDPDPISSFELPPPLSSVLRVIKQVPLGVPLLFAYTMVGTAVGPYLGFRILRTPVSFRPLVAMYAYLSGPQVVSLLLAAAALPVSGIAGARVAVYAIAAAWLVVVTCQLARITGRTRRRCLASLLVGSLLLLGAEELAFGKIVHPFHVQSDASAPAVRTGDFVLANTLVLRFRQPRLGELVAYYPNHHGQPSRHTIQLGRVLGLPGQEVVVHQGVLRIDGEDVKDPWGSWDEPGLCEALDRVFQPKTEWTLSDDQYLIVADNRCSAIDSRVEGPVPESSLVGSIYYRYLPLRSAGLLPQARAR